MDTRENPFLGLKESTQERTNLKEESPRHVLEFRHWRGMVVANCVVAMVRKSRKQHFIKYRQASARGLPPQEVISRPARSAGLLWGPCTVCVWLGGKRKQMTSLHITDQVCSATTKRKPSSFSVLPEPPWESSASGSLKGERLYRILSRSQSRYERMDLNSEAIQWYCHFSLKYFGCNSIFISACFKYFLQKSKGFTSRSNN